jgi:hypothetical protein
VDDTANIKSGKKERKKTDNTNLKKNKNESSAYLLHGAESFVRSY